MSDNTEPLAKVKAALERIMPLTLPGPRTPIAPNIGKDLMEIEQIAAEAITELQNYMDSQEWKEWEKEKPKGGSFVLVSGGASLEYCLYSHKGKLWTEEIHPNAVKCWKYQPLPQAAIKVIKQGI